MNRVLLSMLTLFIFSNAWCQPEPYPVDKSFAPSLSFLQRVWEGTYYGVDPQSRTRLYIQRRLTLSEDMSFTNVTHGGIVVDDVCVDTLLFKEERGTYVYLENRKIVEYTLLSDSVLLLNKYVKGQEVEYKVNRYSTGGNNNVYTENASFTYEKNGVRNWVVQDMKLGSDMKPGMPAVYIMSGTSATSSISFIYFSNSNQNTGMYDLSGRKLRNAYSEGSIVVVNGRKLLLR